MGVVTDPLQEARRLSEIKERYKGWLPIDEWGPKCAGCGDDEYRIDGYCSIECRDYHSDEDVEWLAQRVEDAETALRWIAYEGGKQGCGYSEAEEVARQALRQEEER